MLTSDQLAAIAGVPVSGNLRSIHVGLEAGGRAAGLDQPHRLEKYLGQLMHESAGGRYDREVLGPTPAQLRYDTRPDLGDTGAADGDGNLYMGRGPILVTGHRGVLRSVAGRASPGSA